MTTDVDPRGAPAGDSADEDGGADRRTWSGVGSPRRRPGWRWLVIAALVAATAVVAVRVATGDGGEGTETTATRPVATAEVVRQSIADVRSFDGTLGHGDGVTVTATGEGVVTGIAQQGAEIERGAELYALDEQPVVALFGTAPMYRDLRIGDRGADVAQLIENLHALGHGTDCDSVDELTGCIHAAIATWRGEVGWTAPDATTPVSAAGPGVVTSIAAPGTPVERGTELYRVDDRPVVALFGAIPMYRDLRQGESGADVAQLIENLHALGYGTDCDAVDEFTWCIRTAVREWQDDRGVDDTGRVEVADVVFLPEPDRVDVVHARVGDPVSVGAPVLDVSGGVLVDATGVVIARSEIGFVPDGSRLDTIHTGIGDVIGPGAPVLDVTGTDQIASSEVEVRFRDLLTVGTAVEVQLPGGATVAGIVTAANVVATGDGAGSDDTITHVEVTLLDEVDAALLGAPVDILVEVNERTDVLTVPVNALLALAGGGHGVEVVGADGSTALVPVDTGLFAGGWVEVTGDGIDEGTVVVVAGR